ncbi:MAG: FkbM family methyltransferase [Bacteroidota bacterium]
MNFIKRILLAILGEKKYLSFLAGMFQRMYKIGWLSSDYQDIYFLKEIIEPGSYCVDIGAHLGYFTIELSRLATGSGKVIAIEPMTKFNEVLRSEIKKEKRDNVDVLQVALGGDSEYVEMGIPRVNHMKKFAYARVMKASAYLEYTETEKIKNESGDALFKNLPRLDFIKCDVEGLEVPVFKSMMETLEKHYPVLLCELADKQERIKLYEMLMFIGYQVYILKEKKLHFADVYLETNAISHNHYFIHPYHEERLKHLIAR